MSFKRRSDGRIEQRDDIAIVVGDGVDVIEGKVFGVIHIVLRLCACKESPAAVDVVVGILTIHESHTLSFHSNQIGSEARAATRGQVWPDSLTGQQESFLFHRDVVYIEPRREIPNFTVPVYKLAKSLRGWIVFKPRFHMRTDQWILPPTFP